MRLHSLGLLTTSCQQTCYKPIVRTCYPQAWYKLLQQVVVSLRMTSCNKLVFNRLVAICNKLLKLATCNKIQLRWSYFIITICGIFSWNSIIAIWRQSKIRECTLYKLSSLSLHIFYFYWCTNWLSLYTKIRHMTRSNIYFIMAKNHCLQHVQVCIKNHNQDPKN